MNGKQAARAAAKRIEELEHQITLNIRDIRLYVRCIQSMINHGSPCDYCEDHDECEVAGKDVTIGCDEWMLRLWRPDELMPWQQDVIDGKTPDLFAEIKKEGEMMT